MIFLQLFDMQEPTRTEIIEHSLRSMDFPAEGFPLLMEYFAALRREIHSEIEAAHIRVACRSAKANLRDDELGTAYNALDDIRHGVHAKYEGIASAELASLGYAGLSERLSRMSGGFSVSSFENRGQPEEMQRRMNDFLSLLCKRGTEGD